MELLADNIEIIPLLPIRGLVVFPYTIVHLDVGRHKSLQAIEAARKGSNLICLVAQKDARDDEPLDQELYDWGTVAEIKQILKMPGGTMRILVEGLTRAEIQDFLPGNNYTEIKIRNYVDDETNNDLETTAAMRTAVKLFTEYIAYRKDMAPEVLQGISEIDIPGQLADVIASHMSLKLEIKVGILGLVEVKERLMKVCLLLTEELAILDLEKKLSSQVREQMDKNQRDYYLREQMKAIKQELGDGEDNIQEVSELEEKIQTLRLPADVENKARKELDRFARMPSMVAETVVVRNYLDWLLALPWTETTEDRLNIDKAAQVLNSEHYGLKPVKERILEYLAVRKLAPDIKGQILCLVGPPGVGKTSLGQSIAHALGRKFVRMSLGGVHDEAEIRGHRRTYVGAMPGRILQRMKDAGVKNPVFLLDEIDKMGNDFHGDPASAMLEVLDPEQNHKFTDHFLEIPFDLSQVFFMTTANTTENIPAPLLDRMEVVRLSSYTDEEKLEIAKRHLLHRSYQEHGLVKRELSFSDGAVLNIIRGYTSEAGVRELKRQIDTVARKVALRVTQVPATKVKVAVNNLTAYLGIPRYRHEGAEASSQVGICAGLAWTMAGGELLIIEAILTQGKGNLILTGHLGDVMKESAQTGLTYIKSRFSDLHISSLALQDHDIHIHVPEGATPKDGPSAGITMATALASTLSGYPVRGDVAMTGEITLRGRVLPIGGLKEKFLAAYRAGIKTVLIPRENTKDLEEIPSAIQKKLNIVTVQDMGEVLDIALIKSDLAVSESDAGEMYDG